MSDIRHKILINIKRLMGDERGALARLSERSKIPQSMLSNYLSAKVKLPFEKAEVIAAALGVGFEDLLGVPPPAEAPLREPTELEMVGFIIERADIHPARKPALLGLLRFYLEEERLEAIQAVLKADKHELETILDLVRGLAPKKKAEKKQQA